MNVFMNQTPMTFLFCVKQTWMSHLIQAIRSYLPLIRNDSVTHMFGLVVNVKEELHFAWDGYLKNSKDSHFCFQLPLTH